MSLPPILKKNGTIDATKLPLHIDLQELIVSPEALACLSEQSAVRLGMLPVAIVTFDAKAVLILACASTVDTPLVERVEQLLDYRFIPHFVSCNARALSLAIKRLYAVIHTPEKLLQLSSINVDKPVSPEAFTDYPVHLLDALLLKAARMGASDLHLSPEQHFLAIRVRVDGVLLNLTKMSCNTLSSLLVRIKVVAALDIAETRLPQDGQFRRLIDGQSIDFRVSTFPTVTGENTVIRLIDAQNQLSSLDALNLPEAIGENLRVLVKRPAGLLVCCGPTGAGKSTTLFALLKQLDHHALSVMTLEDPVEQRIEGIRQTSIDASRQWGYPQALRALLRQDPDVLLVGEIRDPDSCAIALRAVSTGHQVLTTVHAHDVRGALHRLQDLHANKSALALGLSAIVAQRLVRRLCTACQGRTLACNLCFGTGYKGRQVIMEVLEINAEFREGIMQGKGLDTLFRHSVAAGFINMRTMAKQLVRSGVTDAKEVNRVLGLDTTESA